MSEKEKLLRKVSRLCLDNAERYAQDAKILLKKRSWAHAFALAVFAEEETAKAVMYHLCAEGIYGDKGKWRRETTKHKSKQSFAAWMAFIYEQSLLLEEAFEFARMKARNDPARARQIFETKRDEVLKRESMRVAQERGDLYRHLKYFEKLQEKREKAMYVEANIEEMKVGSPKEFKKSEAKEYVSHVEERLEVLADEIEGKMKLTTKQMTMTTIKKRLSQLNEEQKRELLDWYGLSVEELDRFNTSDE
jgi:AbiV family abortive infection protein